MFTGIIEEIGVVAQAGRNQLRVHGRLVMADIGLGDSICVNGVCLTVAARGEAWFSVDVMPETLRRTNLGLLRPGSLVNLERALPAGGRMGGHFVQGHVDGTGSVLALQPEEDAVVVRMSLPSALERYVVPQGFIAVDGASLTVVDCGAESFSVSLVRHTQAHTTLSQRRAGDLVNLEADVLGKYVERMLGRQPAESGGRVTEDLLRKAGF